MKTLKDKDLEFANSIREVFRILFLPERPFSAPVASYPPTTWFASCSRCPCDLAHSISCPHGVDCMVLRLSQGHLASIHALRPPEEEPACAWIPGRSTHDRNR